MTSKVTSSTVSEVKFASETDNINPLTLSDIKNGFAGCSGAGIPMTSANFNAVLNWITENIGLQEDIVVETIDDKKYLITKAKDGSRAKIEIVELIKGLRDSGVVTTGDLPKFGNGIKFDPENKNHYIGTGDGVTINESGDLSVLLSEKEGNNLRFIDGKLYQGTESREQLKNLFVDAVDGVDQDPLAVVGAGTREMPLRTLTYALSLADPNTNRAVFLHEAQDHRMSATQEITLKTGSVYIESYGTRYDALISSGIHDRRTAHETVHKEGLQARIVFEGVKTRPYLDYSEVNFLCIAVPNNTSLNIQFCGIHNEYPTLLEPLASVSNKRLAITRGSRIQTDTGGIVELEGVHFTSSALPTVSPTASNQSEVVSNLPLLGLVYPLYGSLDIRRVFGLQNDYKGMLVGSGFWEFPLSGSSNLALSSVGDLLPQITKKIRLTTVNNQNGVKQVLAPTVDVDPNLFL